MKHTCLALVPDNDNGVWAAYCKTCNIAIPSDNYWDQASDAAKKHNKKVHPGLDAHSGAPTAERDSYCKACETSD